MSGQRILVLILGSLATMIGLFVIAVGVAGVIASSLANDGFLESDTQRLQSPRNALVSEDIAADGPRWLFSEDRLTLRISVEAADPDQSIFVGVGPVNSIADYLDGASYDVLAEVDYPDFDVLYEPVMGGRTPARPGNQDFWVASAEGTGRQEIEWDIASGNWSVAVVNSNGSRPVVVDASVGVKLAFLTPLGIGALVLGAILLIGGIVMIVVGIRKGSKADPPGMGTATTPPDQTTF